MAIGMKEQSQSQVQTPQTGEQYLFLDPTDKKLKRKDSTGTVTNIENPGGPGGGVTDHGALTGLGDDDHSQYHTDARGDARYYTKSQVDSSLGGKENTGVAANLVGAHELASDPHSQYALESDVATALSGKENTGVAAGLLSSHTGAANPHSQYALQSAVNAALANKSDVGHTHNSSEIVGLPTYQFTTTTVSTNSTVVTVPELNVALLANKKYLLEFYLFVRSDAQAVLRFRPDYPSGYLRSYAGMGGPQSSGSAVLAENPANGTQISQYISTQPGDFTLGYLQVYVENGNTPGNFVFKYSSHAGTFGEIRAGSYVRITRLN